MVYCWKCGEQLQQDGPCPVCGATADSRRPLPEDASAAARAMRGTYDRYGCKQTLTQPVVLYNALGDILGENGESLASLVSTAIEAGLGGLYLTELAQPMQDFDAQVVKLLADVGFSGDVAQDIKSLFDDMTGLPVQETPAEPAEESDGGQLPAQGKPDLRTTILTWLTGWGSLMLIFLGLIWVVEGPVPLGWVFAVLGMFLSWRSKGGLFKFMAVLFGTAILITSIYMLWT